MEFSAIWYDRQGLRRQDAKTVSEKRGKVSQRYKRAIAVWTRSAMSLISRSETVKRTLRRR